MTCRQKRKDRPLFLVQGATHGAFTRGAAQHIVGCGGRRLYPAFSVPVRTGGIRFDAAAAVLRRSTLRIQCDGAMAVVSCACGMRHFRGGRRIRSVVSVGRFAGLRPSGRHFRFRSERGGVVCAGGTHRGRCVPEEEARRCVRKIRSVQSDFHVGVNQDAM